MFSEKAHTQNTIRLNLSFCLWQSRLFCVMADPGIMFRVDISGEEETSRRCQLKGRYIFGVKDSSLCLCDITSNHVLYEWPYVYIRRFGKKRKAFYFEAGRRCTSGEGVFTLETDQYIQIFHAAKEKTTWKLAQEHAVLSGDILEGELLFPKVLKQYKHT